MKKINKKYTEIMEQVDVAVGRKEFVSLLKKAFGILNKALILYIIKKSVTDKFESKGMLKKL